MQNMFDVLADPDIQPGRLFVYGGFDADASKHLLSEKPPGNPWVNRFPIGRTIIVTLAPSGTGRVRFEMVNLDNDDSDVWAGQANALRCLIDPSVYKPVESEQRREPHISGSYKGRGANLHQRPKTICLRMNAALALSAKQKAQLAELSRLESQMYMRHVSGIRLHGQIERLSASSPMLASIMNTEIAFRFRKYNADR